MERGERRWRNIKERLRFKGISCCGSTWGFGVSIQMNVREEESEGEEEEIMRDVVIESLPENGCVGQIPAVAGMNLAAALAAERNIRAAQEWEVVNEDVPLKVSLMKLLEEEGERNCGERERRENEGDGLCCVCMGKKKGAALIPCGHTYCRVCTRELWLNRGACPLCNRSILEILDIF